MAYLSKCEINLALLYFLIKAVSLQKKKKKKKTQNGKTP